MHYLECSGLFMQWLTVECEQSLAPARACARAFERCLSQTPKALFALPQEIEFAVCKKREKFVITNFFVFVTLFASDTREIFHFTTITGTLIGQVVKIEEFTFIVASWVIRAKWREIRRLVLEFKASYFFLNSYI